MTKNQENIKINQYEVSEIVYSRIKEILINAKKEINLLTKKEISYIIITGGTTELMEFTEVAKEIFGKKYKVCSQWYEDQRVDFDNWYEKIISKTLK